jgi:hypothetical protein
VCSAEKAVCFETRACSCSCGDAEVEGVVKCSEIGFPEGEGAEEDTCEDLWGSCHFAADASGCEQTKVTSALNQADGKCYEAGGSSRECHVQTCAADPVRVPFKVQVIVGLANVTVPDFLFIHRQFVEDAVAPMLGVDEGDVHFVSVAEWIEEEGEESKGAMATLDVSIKNAAYDGPVEDTSDQCDQIVEVANVAGNGVVAKADAGFGGSLAVALKRFKEVSKHTQGIILIARSLTRSLARSQANPAFDDAFADMSAAQVLDVWLVRALHCRRELPPGTGDGHGGAAGTVFVSFLITASIIAAFVHYQRKQRKALLADGGKYTTVKVEEEGVEMM